MSDLFGNTLEGSLLLDEVWDTFSDGFERITIPWLNDKGERNIVKHDSNRAIQETTVLQLKLKMLKKGVNHGVGGEPWMQYSVGRTLPAKALTWNHRVEAFYRAHAEDPTNPFIVQALSKGLIGVRMLRDNVPRSVMEWLVNYHNDWHSGSGFSVVQLIKLAMQIEAFWIVKCKAEKLKAKDAGYDAKYDAFLKANAQGRMTKWKHYDCAKAFAHRLKKFDIYDKTLSWLDAETDYLHPALQYQSVLSVLHTLAPRKQNSKPQLRQDCRPDRHLSVW